MFTGLIQAVGTVQEVVTLDGGLRMSITVPDDWASRLHLGDSVAIDGCCTTVTSLTANTFTFEASPETLRRTVMGTSHPGHRVNLELPLTPSTPMGGHYVTGHVDVQAVVVERTEEGLSWILRLQLPAAEPSWMRYLIEKGSIALNGISLTVNTVRDEDRTVTVAIIPHTWGATNIDQWQVGSEVNVEFDLLGKYVERLAVFSR